MSTCHESLTLATLASRLWIAAFVFAFVHASFVHAQVTTEVVIRMDGTCNSSAPNIIDVILAVGDNVVQFSVKREDVTSPWKGTYPLGRTFPADRASAILLLGGTRTDCEKSVARNDVANFVFHCYQEPARDVTVSADGPIAVSYTRRSCLERREVFTAGRLPSTIKDFWIPREELRFSLGWRTPNPPDPGLLVLSMDAGDKGYPVFSAAPGASSLLVFGKVAHRRADGTVQAVLHERKVVDALEKQRFAKSGRLSPNARDNDHARLQHAGLNTLTLTVK